MMPRGNPGIATGRRLKGVRLPRCSQPTQPTISSAVMRDSQIM